MRDYTFNLDTTPLRQHRLYAHALNDDELKVADAKKLIRRFEERFLTDWYWDLFERGYRPSCRRLTGFKGDRHWRNATLRFYVRSPEIPFFGEEASRLCAWTPILYSSVKAEGTSQRTDFRYFLNGKEYREWDLPDFANEFAKLVELNSGFIPGRVTIDQFF